MTSMSCTKTSRKSNRVTVADLARQLHISPTTVSFVLNGRAEEHRISHKTAKRIRREAEKKHYRPSPIARQLTGMRSNAVGVLVSSAAVIDPRLLQHMEILAAQRDVRFIVGHAVGTHEQVKKYLDDFRARGVDGIISAFHCHPDFAAMVLPELLQFDNVVYYEKPDGNQKAMDSLCYVQPNYYRAGCLGVQHAIDRGRKRIALVLNDLKYPYARTRHQAYKDMLKVTGRRINRRLIWILEQRSGRPWSERFSEEDALQVVDDVVVSAQADAIVAVNDHCAARLIAALRHRGRRVPDDVAIIGCDNLDLGTLVDPKITTIDLHILELAEAMTRLLFDLLDHGCPLPNRRAVVVEPTLIQRESS